MQNVEIKVRCGDLNCVETLIKEMDDVKSLGTLHQRDTYFCVKIGRLKLREIKDDHAELIQYERPDDAGTRTSQYVLAPIDDPEGLKTALGNALGVLATVDKVRKIYVWANTRIHLDVVGGLGSFVELETVITDQTMDDAKTECRKVAEHLKIDREIKIGGSYSDMLLSKSEVANIKEDRI